MQSVDPTTKPIPTPVEQGQSVKKKKKKPKKTPQVPGIRRESLNMIRTTYRNNIELTNIADNKANILLSLNALMITFLIPIVLSNLDIIIAKTLYLPIITLSATCFTTIILAALATRPIKMGDQNVKHGDTSRKSPFFFGNYFQMRPVDYLNLVEKAIDDPSLLREYIKQDLYFMGKGLGEKYTKIRLCYNVFIWGLVLTVMATLVVLLA